MTGTEMKFKVGDRVRLVGYSSGGAPVEGQRGTVIFANGGLIMRVKVDAPFGNGEDVVIVYVSQALKLKPQVQK